MPPEHDRVGVFKVGGWKPAIKSEGMSEILVPVAYLGGVADVKGCRSTARSVRSINAVRDRRAALDGSRESNCFGAVLLADRCQFRCRFGKRLLPTNPLPSGAIFAFGGYPAHGIVDSARAVNNPPEPLALHAYGFTSRLRGSGSPESS